jgi:D-methionine transport system ATP-binding protein
MVSAMSDAGGVLDAGRRFAFVSTAPARSSGPPPPLAGAPLVRLAGVSKRFGTLQALADIALDVAQSEILGIIGRSGAGKSTLIRCLNGLERPDAGRVEIEGRDIARLGERALQPVRRRIGMIFQHFNLLSARTVEQNIALPLKIAGQPRTRRQARVAELLELVGLVDKARAYPAQLSGGQKQRVGIARALAANPVLLLSDEATSALDPETTLSILDLLRDINRRLGLTIVLITHEMSVIRSIADRVVVLEDGRVIETGPVWRVFARPQADSTRRLLLPLQPQLPPEIAARLNVAASPGSGVVVRLDVHGAQARAPLLAELSQSWGTPIALLHGGIDHVQGEPIGTLFVRLPGGGEDVSERLRGCLDERVTAWEVLGHVPGYD